MSTNLKTKPEVSVVKLLAIEEGRRFREEMGDVEELARSIRDKGLINPLTVCPAKEDSEYEWRLLAGGRRYNAMLFNMMQHKGSDETPVRIYSGDLSELELRVIELEENIERKDLSWQEEAMLCKEIHGLQVQIHGPKISTSPDAPGHSLRDTAKYMGKSPTAVSRNIKLAEVMEEMPEVDWSKVKTQDDAVKAMKKIDRAAIRGDLVKAAQEEMARDGKDIKERMTRCYIVKDFFEGVKTIPANTFDLVEIDPPYGINLKEVKRDYKDNYSGYNEVDVPEYESFMRRTLNEAWRVMAPDSWLICWFGPEPWFEKMYQWIIEEGFRTHRMCGLWVKPSGQTLNATKRLGNAYEMFFYASKGNPTICKPGSSNVFPYTGDSDKKHPTQRPVALMADVLTTFAEPNSNILVPFAGSGATLLAAFESNMHPVGYDLTDHYKQEYIIRLNKEY